ncbi:MAG: AlbA family DNA-binding domain-containing protein [Bacteroidota bacterium]
MEWFYHTKGNDITAGDIEKLVQHQMPAHQHLHFLDGRSFSHKEKYLTRLAKTVSAMANSGGGILITGVKTYRHKARDFTLINNEKPDTDLIHHHLIANISPFPHDISITYIEVYTGQYCLVIKIPAGKKPLMFSDYRYYGFHNHKVNKLDVDAVSALHNKTTQKHLEIYSIYNTQGIPEMKDGKFSVVRFYPKVLIHNAGDSIEKDYKMEIIMPAPLYEENSNLTNHFSHYEGKYVVFGFTGKNPVFGSEIHLMLDFTLKVTQENIDSFEKDMLHFKLYYSDGVHRQSFPLHELFTYRGKMLKTADFTTT